MNIFFDTEFTGLHQRTTLISIGLVSEDDRTFYAEFTDYNSSQVTDWVEEHVLKNLTTQILDEYQKSYIMVNDNDTIVRGDSQYIAGALTSWLMQFNETLYFWADCPAYDWVLFCELFGGAQYIPDDVYYIPFDLSTYRLARGYIVGSPRKESVKVPDSVQHNALDDARNVYALWCNT